MTTRIPIFRLPDARRLATYARRQVPLGKEEGSAAFPDDDGLDNYLIYLEEGIPAGAWNEDMTEFTPGLANCLLCGIYLPEEDASRKIFAHTVPASSGPYQPIRLPVFNISTDPIDALQFCGAYQERITGNLIAVTGGGGACEPCANVFEITSGGGTVTGGSIGIAFTVEGSTGSTCTINHNHSATTVKTNLISSHSFLNADNLAVYDGPISTNALYIRFQGEFAESNIPMPVPTVSLTGTNVTARIRRFSIPGWP